MTTAKVRRTSSVLGQTATLAALSALSPVAGLAVEMALAWRFGTAPVVDAYRVTALMILFGQQLFATSVLPYVLVPYFAECRARGKEEDAWAAADALARLFLILGGALSIALFCFPAFAATLLAPGLSGEGRVAAVQLIRWCGLAYLPVCWSGVAFGVLYAYGVFIAAPLCQLVSNASLLASLTLGRGSASLMIGLLGGALASAGLCAFFFRSVRSRFGPARSQPARLADLRGILRLATPLAGGILVGQFSGAIMARSLSRLAAGSLATFGYSWKLGQIVLLVPTALSTVLFPKLSQTWQQERPEAYRSAYVKALRAALFLAIPAAAAVFALREPIVKFLLERGAFPASASHSAAALLGLLTLGAPATASAIYLDRMFYSVRQTTPPVLVDAILALAAMIAVPVVARRFGAGGVASVYGVIPWITCGLLAWMFHRGQRDFPWREISGFALRLTAIGGASAWVGGAAVAMFTARSSGPFLGMAIGGGFLLSVALFYGAAMFLGLPEAGYLRHGAAAS